VVDPTTGGTKGGKPAQFSRLPWDVLQELAVHYARGAEKYPDAKPGVANWQLGYAWSLNFSALLRHLTSFWLGEDIDPETGSPHLCAVLWHAAALRWFQIHGKGTDDRPRP